MAEQFNADLNIIAQSNLEIELLDGDLNIIQKLDDEPNDVGGLSSDQLKAKFDEAGNTIKDYLNGTLIPAVLAEDATEAARKAAEAARVAAEEGRVSAEGLRAQAETARDQAETARADAEGGRADAESARVEAESARVAAEAARADENTGIVNRATVQADQAASSAGAAKAYAEGAADSATSAGGSARTAAVAATAAEEAATAARGSATAAADSAVSAAESAAKAEQIVGGDFATKVKGGTEGHLAALDGEGDLADSGKKPGDFALAVHDHKKADITDFPASMAPTAHAESHRTGGTDALGPGDIGACGAPVAVAVTLAVGSWAADADGCQAQSVDCAGLLATDDQSTVTVLPNGGTDADARILIDEAYAAVAGPGGKFLCESDGVLTAVCPKGGTAPTVALPLIVCIAR